MPIQEQLTINNLKEHWKECGRESSRWHEAIQMTWNVTLRGQKTFVLQPRQLVIWVRQWRFVSNVSVGSKPDQVAVVRTFYLWVFNSICWMSRRAGFVCLFVSMWNCDDTKWWELCYFLNKLNLTYEQWWQQRIQKCTALQKDELSTEVDVMLS